MSQSPPGPVDAAVRYRLDPLCERLVGRSCVPARGRHEHVRHSSGTSSWSSTITAGRSLLGSCGRHPPGPLTTRWCRRLADPPEITQRRPDLVELISRLGMSGEVAHHPISLRPERLPPKTPRLGLGNPPNEREQPLTLLAGGRLQSFPVVWVQSDPARSGQTPRAVRRAGASTRRLALRPIPRASPGWPPHRRCRGTPAGLRAGGPVVDAQLLPSGARRARPWGPARSSPRFMHARSYRRRSVQRCGRAGGATRGPPHLVLLSVCWAYFTMAVTTLDFTPLTIT